jgi:hypothetical protein
MAFRPFYSGVVLGFACGESVVAQLELHDYGRGVAKTSDGRFRPYLLAPCFRSDMPMTNLEIRVAALQFLSLRLCAALSLEQLEEIRQSTLDGVRASDVESMQMQSEFLKLLDDAIDRARQKQAATATIKSSVHLA